MREIRFRGKTKSTNEWVYGVPIFARTNCDNGHYEIIMLMEYETELEWSVFVDSEEVVEETICQYTGLKDKNDKEIYEGDILKDNRGQFGKVFYHTDGARFLVNWLFEGGYYETDSCFGYGEVIGNIFDNPELLEEQDDA